MTAPQPLEIDVAIIGAGINGAGLFRDLCEQGVSCILCDKADFGSGTSAAPSRLIHGGLKYLETGEFGLVAQSTLERNLLLRNAPHTVTPLPSVIPIFSWTAGMGAALRTLFGSTKAPRSRGALLIKAGLAIYDLLGARSRVMPSHRMAGRKAALAGLPQLNPRIVATGTYYDAKISHPERLVLELILDGLDANHASHALNYTAASVETPGVLSLCRFDGATFSIRPKIVVNAAGPWIDSVNAMLGAPSRMIGGTKGSHILLRHDELVRSLAGRMLYFEADDGRICLVYEYLGLALVGSTDIKADDPDWVRCGADEVGYFLASLRSLLPGFRFDPSQMVYAYSGIRPLPASDALAPGLISRDHSAPIAEPENGRPFPIVSLVGGKWTTFRGFAEEVADTLLARLGRTRLTSTRALPIGGGREFPASSEARRAWIERESTATGLSEVQLETLLQRYGTRAAAIARHRQSDAHAAEPSDPTALCASEIDFIARREYVVRLADIVLRRTTLAITGALTRAELRRIASIAGPALGWSQARIDGEIATVESELLERHLSVLRP